MVGPMNIDLAPRHLAALRRILSSELGGVDCRVYMFGSRVRGSSRVASDVDLAVVSGEDVSGAISRARLAFEESNLPYQVDLVDLKHAAVDLRAAIAREGKEIWAAPIKD